jgi:hypothetical protein
MCELHICDANATCMLAVRRDARLISNCFFYIPLLALAFWCCGFVLTRVQLYAEALVVEQQRRKHEEWLMQQCKSPEFYANMKHHSALCDQVEAHARGSVHLVAAIQLIQNTYLCGYAPCGTVIDHALLWITGHGVLFGGALLLLVLLTPTLLVPLYRQHVNHAAEKYIADRIHMPYGEQHFFHQGHRRPTIEVFH